MGYDRAIADWKRISQAEWSVDIELTSPSPASEIANVKGFSSIHHFQIDPETGIPVNSRNAHVSFPESVILEANPNYPTRNNGEIYLKNHFVKFNDSSGQEVSFKIDQQFPDETIDLIVCILGNYVDQ